MYDVTWSTYSQLYNTTNQYFLKFELSFEIYMSDLNITSKISEFP